MKISALSRFAISSCSGLVYAYMLQPFSKARFIQRRGHRRPATVGSPALTKGGEEETPPLTPIIIYHIGMVQFSGEIC